MYNAKSPTQGYDLNMATKAVNKVANSIGLFLSLNASGNKYKIVALI